MSQIAKYTSVANALLWLGNQQKVKGVNYIDKPPVFFLSEALTQEMIAVTYSRELQKWLLLTDSADSLSWFSDMPWAVIIVGKDYLMPVCKDVEIPARYRTSQSASIPKFALKMNCITPVATAFMQQDEIYLGKYVVEDDLVTVDNVIEKPIRILNRSGLT